MLQEVREERVQLQNFNNQLQHKLAEYFKKKKVDFWNVDFFVYLCSDSKMEFFRNELINLHSLKSACMIL